MSGGTGELAGRVALVTGAARGIGRAVARRLAQAGAQVLAIDRDAEALTRAAGDDGTEALVLDLGQPDAPDAAVCRALDLWGRIDVVVNNAAYHGERRSGLDADRAEWEAVFAVNVHAAAMLTRAAARDMARRGEGAIVNVGSVQFALPAPGYTPYVASKGALEGLTRAFAVELGGLGIRVNAVAPGVIATENYAENLKELSAGEAPKLASLLGRAGTPDGGGRGGALPRLARARASSPARRLAVDGGRARQPSQRTPSKST